MARSLNQYYNEIMNQDRRRKNGTASVGKLLRGLNISVYVGRVESSDSPHNVERGHCTTSFNSTNVRRGV